MIAEEPPTALDRFGRFDWYATTILERPARLIEVLCARLHGVPVTSKPQQGYGEGVEVRSGDRVLCTIWYGGGFEWPHAFATSDETDAFVSVVRDVWPDAHNVTRMDCALDFDAGPGTFQSLLDICTPLADGVRVDGDTRKRASRVSVRNVGDWTFGREGRTFYMGSTKSAVTVRLYEKGIELRQKAERLGAPRDDVSLSLTRLEVQVRPDGAARRRAARTEPLAAFGYAEWTRELLRRVQDAAVERVHIRERRLSDHERAMRWVAHQYRKHFMHAVDRLGSWEALGAELEARIMHGVHGELPTDEAPANSDPWDDTPF